MITSNTPEIDLFKFEKRFSDFYRHVEEMSGSLLTSFAANPYTEEEEGYKYEVFSQARKILDVNSWARSDIGTGSILHAMVNAIELPDNNLVRWQGHQRYGPGNLPQHHALIAALQEKDAAMARYEELLFSLYRNQLPEQQIFHELVTLLGKKYPLMAYFYFLKDRNKFMPISPDYFDKAFELLGVPLKTSRKCSWENYSQYNAVLSELRWLLIPNLGDDVTLLDAHSFTWMLATKVPATPETETQLREYDDLPPKDVEVVQKARVGQGRFRAQVLRYWNFCAITGCKDDGLLIASHIKPWSQSSPREAIDPFNGLLLTPNLDHVFDKGYISFDDSGKILISNKLDSDDAAKLGITPKMKLRRIEDRHKSFLHYHRQHIFDNDQN